MQPHVLKDQDFKEFSTEGGRSFKFTPILRQSFIRKDARYGANPWRAELHGNPRAVDATPAVAPPLLMSHVRVLDAKAGKFSADESMLIEKGRVRWSGAESGHQIPANAVRLDGGGRFAVPGLADSHVHTAWSNEQITEDSLIAYGVTSVRDTGSRLDLINALKDRGDTTLLPVPRYFASGDIFEGLMPLWGDAFMEITPKKKRANTYASGRAWGRISSNCTLRSLVCEERRGGGGAPYRDARGGARPLDRRGDAQYHPWICHAGARRSDQ